MSALDRSAAQVSHSTEAVVAGAGAVDAADAAAAAGDAVAGRRLQLTGQISDAGAVAALRALPEQVRHYRQALDTLAAATHQTPTAQGEVGLALTDVVSSGRHYADAAEQFDRYGLTGWPAFASLETAETTWLVRASAGWFRSPTEAAAAYAVLTSDQRPRVQQARSALADADRDLGLATERNRLVLTAANQVLR